MIMIIAVISIAPYRTDEGEHMTHFYSNKGDTKYPCVFRRTQLPEILDYLQFVTCTVRRSGKWATDESEKNCYIADSL